MDTESPKFIHDTRRIVSANAEACALFRCDERALIDQDMVELIADEEWKGLARLRLNVMREKGPPLPNLTYPFRRCDGSVFRAGVVSVKQPGGLIETVVIYESEE